MAVTAHHVRVAPLRRRRRDEELGCDVLEMLAYRASCSCGWRGQGTSSVREARAEAAAHRRGAGVS